MLLVHFLLVAFSLFAKQYTCIPVTITVNFSQTTFILKTETTLQVVVNPLLTRESPIYSNTYKMLANLSTDYVRFVPWYPYARLGVAQLTPPSGKYLCNHLNGDSYQNSWSMSLQCPLNSTIKSIEFVSWGNPTGYCGNFTIGSCHSNNSLSVAKQYCLNKNSCTIPVNTTTFNGDPCYGVVKQFAIQVECSIAYNYSNYNFTLLDPLLIDFMNAVNPNKTENKTIINYSTIPNWFYKNVSYGEGYTDNPYDNSVDYNLGYGENWIDNGLEKIGKYYANLINWYTNGGFIDEYGNKYISNHSMLIDYWEILNEPFAEHKNSIQSYTLLYDNIIKQIQKYADPNKQIKFVGIALEGACTWETFDEWFTYFLNISNHISNDIPLDWVSFHHYANTYNRTNPIAYQEYFTDIDTFIELTYNITKIRDQLSPQTKIDIDEFGCFLPSSSHTDQIPNIFWNAAGAAFGYGFGKVSELGIDVIGESQLMGNPKLSQTYFPASPGGIPARDPDVTEIDWNTGIGNARYWVLKLLSEHIRIGMNAVQTTIDNEADLYGQAYLNEKNGDKLMLLVNKKYSNISVVVNDMEKGILHVVDESTGENEARIVDIQTNQFVMSPFAVGVLYML